MQQRPNLLRVRSIPACAGEPSTKTLSDPLGTADTGQSPRVRGNHQLREAGRLVLRSIPACAGEPRCMRPQGTCRWVYPRVCGGTSPNYNLVTPVLGLSPRVRGNQRREVQHYQLDRSIPACAGEPCSFDHAIGTSVRVYPRVCGGTILTCQLRRLRSVYPRVCGGTRCRLESPARRCASIPVAGEPSPRPSLSGLSPRVRGNRHSTYESPRSQCTVRSIPACAGEPRD